MQTEIEVALDFVGIFIGVDAEVTEVAAFAAERDMEIESEWDFGFWGVFEGFGDIADVFFFPERKGRIIGNEIVACGGVVAFGEKMSEGVGLHAEESGMRGEIWMRKGIGARN